MNSNPDSQLKPKEPLELHKIICMDMMEGAIAKHIFTALKFAKDHINGPQDWET